MQTVIKLSQKVKWNGANSWHFGIEDSNRNITPITSGCLSGQPQPAIYEQGANLTLSMSCNSLPRELRKGDKLWAFVFGDHDNPDFWLMFNIPIEGFSELDSKTSQK